MLTPNGKVNRHALPAPGKVNSGIEESYVVLRNSTEEILQRSGLVLNLERRYLSRQLF